MQVFMLVHVLVTLQLPWRDAMVKVTYGRKSLLGAYNLEGKSMTIIGSRQISMV